MVLAGVLQVAKLSCSRLHRWPASPGLWLSCVRRGVGGRGVEARAGPPPPRFPPSLRAEAAGVWLRRCPPTVRAGVGRESVSADGLGRPQCSAGGGRALAPVGPLPDAVPEGLQGERNGLSRERLSKARARPSIETGVSYQRSVGAPPGASRLARWLPG